MCTIIKSECLWILVKYVVYFQYASCCYSSFEPACETEVVVYVYILAYHTLADFTERVFPLIAFSCWF